MKKTINVIKCGRGRPPKNKNLVSNPAVKEFKNNQNKTFVNFLFSSQIIFLKKQHPHNLNNFIVGVLDSIERNTCNALMAVGIQKQEILLVEQNSDIALSHMNDGFQTYHGDLKSLATSTASNWSQRVCLGWYFDMFGTISTQKDGIFSVIYNLNLTDGSILAFTFCRRGMTAQNYKNQKATFINQLSEHLKLKGFELNSLLFEHNYSGKYMFDKSRGSPMDSFVYAIKLTQN